MTPETQAEEGAWLSLHVIDTAQTSNIARTPGVIEKESAWAIGEKPSPDRVYAYMGAMALAHYAAADYMDAHDWPRWIRRTFEAVTISDSARCVADNKRNGLSVSFSFSANRQK
jgi:hypothetical protein